MKEQGHGNHWGCIGNKEEVIKEILPKIVQEGDVVNKSEVYANCLEGESPSKQTVFSISIDAELSAKALIVTNTKNKTNEIVSAFPIAKSSNIINLK